MAQRLDWPRYTRWTWMIAIVAFIILMLMWLTGRGPSAATSCCGAAPVVAAQVAPAAVPAPAAPSSVDHKATWEGSKLTLEGNVPDDATKKAIVSAAAAKHGADNVIDKLTVDAAAKGPVTVTLLGTVASDAVKATRGDEAKAYYPAATIDNQLTVTAAPAAKAEDVQCSGKIAIAATFATGTAELTAEARNLLDAVVPCMKGSFEIGGHTDNVGSPESNLALSKQRASAVYKYMVSKGFDPKSMTARGYGDTAPIADNTTAEGRAKNRRIEYKDVSK